jgi:hypothetical protein
MSDQLTSDEFVIQEYIENLDSSHVSYGTWDLLHSGLNQTFPRAQSISTKLIDETTLTPITLRELHSRMAYIYTNYTPQTHQELSKITENRVSVVGQMDQTTLEQCESPLKIGRLYTTGEYSITPEFANCMGDTRVYLDLVDEITFPVTAETFDNLRKMTVKHDLDTESIQHLLPYKRHLTVLGERIPKWILNNIEELNALTLNLPEVEQISAYEAKKLANFSGRTLKLNGLKSISKKRSKKFERISQQSTWKIYPLLFDRNERTERFEPLNICSTPR